jgi:hypothetical protein
MVDHFMVFLVYIYVQPILPRRYVFGWEIRPNNYLNMHLQKLKGRAQYKIRIFFYREMKKGFDYPRLHFDLRMSWQFGVSEFRLAS